MPRPLLFRADPRAAALKPLQVAAPDIEAWLLARDPRAIGAYDSIGREEYARAFTAARTAGTDIADDLYYAMVDNVARRGTETDFADLVIPTLKAKGWLGGDEGQIAARVRLIYDTNLRLARAAGRWTHYQASKDALPYLRAFTVGDERVRHPPKSASDHRAWDGIILAVDHPFWTEYWPPLGFRCRCAVVQMTRSQLARYKDGVTSDAELEDRKRRLGAPVFLAPAAPIGGQLAAMTDRSNNPDRGRMPGLPPVDPRRTAQEGGNIWDAVLTAKHRDDIGAALARHGFR
jgi:hypothetical protein